MAETGNLSAGIAYVSAMFVAVNIFMNLTKSRAGLRNHLGLETEEEGGSSYWRAGPGSTHGCL